MAAAFAAFWSVYFSRRIQQRRDDLEDKVRKPYFQILLENTELFETPKQQPTYKFHFANMSQGFILLRQAVIFDSQPHYWGPDYPDRPGPLVPDIPNFIIAPGEIKEKVINLIEIQKLGRTNMYFYFQHSVTGTVLYRLKLPVDIFLSDKTGQRVMSLSVYEQKIEGPVSQPFGVAGITLTIPEVSWEQ